jgi:peroxiredoxin
MKGRLFAVMAIVLVLGVGLAVAVAAFGKAVTPVKVGEEAADFTLPDLSGTPHSLSQFRGQPVLVNFFASWCEPCKEEAPHLRTFAELYGDKVKLLLVNRAEPAVLVEEFVRENQLKSLVLLDRNNQVSKRYGIIAQPETLVIDENGILKYHQKGPLTVEGMVQLVEELTGTTLQEP